MPDMDERLAKQYWWEAYLASLSGILTSEPEATWSVHHMSAEHADVALAAFEKRWPEKEAGDA